MNNHKVCYLIDDDYEDQEIFVTAVNEVNPAFYCAVKSDAESALLELKESAQLADIIFLDINMPKMDGFEFIIHLKRDSRLKSIPVIFYSTTRDEDQISKATKLGASGFITKTASYKELIKTLKWFLTNQA